MLDDDEVDVLRAELERVIEYNGKEEVVQPVRIANLSRDDASPFDPTLRLAWKFRKKVSCALLSTDIQWIGKSKTKHTMKKRWRKGLRF
mgnify:CR=1 FL=1